MKFDKATQEKLQQDLRDARQAAIEAYNKGLKEHGGDGGTCNFDSAVLRFPRVQASKVEACAQAVGERLYRFPNGGYHLSVPYGAQGFLRTMQAEAQHKLLKERGWDVGMYYAMD